MLELYHNINSVCAQKVRIALAEKGQKVTEHLLTLQGDQNDLAYMQLNCNSTRTAWYRHWSTTATWSSNPR